MRDWDRPRSRNLGVVLEFVFALRGALGVRAVADFGGGLAEFALSEVEDARGFRGALGRCHQRFGAGGFGEGEHVLAETVDAGALQLAQFGDFALDGLEGVQTFALLLVGRVTQLVDGAADAARFGFFAGGGAERTLAQQQEQR